MSEKKRASRRSAQRPGRAARRFRVGDTVAWRFAGQKRVARVVEDRGNIGRGGRQLLRVAYVGKDGKIREAFELPADAVTAVRPSPRKNRTTKAKAA